MFYTLIIYNLLLYEPHNWKEIGSKIHLSQNGPIFQSQSFITLTLKFNYATFLLLPEIDLARFYIVFLSKTDEFILSLNGLFFKKVCLNDWP